MSCFSFALIQLRPSRAKDRQQFYNENMANAVRRIRDAAAQGATVAVLPEQFARDASCPGKIKGNVWDILESWRRSWILRS